MNKILILVLFPLFVFSQNIKGKITDANQQPIAGASVYLDGTTIGTVSDADGLFEITSKSKFNTLLIIKFITRTSQNLYPLYWEICPSVILLIG